MKQPLHANTTETPGLEPAIPQGPAGQVPVATPEPQRPPSPWKSALKFGFLAGLVGMFCCVAPAVLFLLGLMSAAFAVSFADFFYRSDDSPGVGAWVLRGLGAVIGVAGLALYRRRQDQCSLDPRRRRVNLFLAACVLTLVGVTTFFALGETTGWYFANYVVPARDAEQGDRHE